MSCSKKSIRWTPWSLKWRLRAHRVLSLVCVILKVVTLNIIYALAVHHVRTRPKLILYMHCLHHNLPHGISLYMWGIEWNPIQLRHWRCPFKSVNNDAIESVMKINMCTKTFSVMHSLQVYWHRVKWDWHLIYAEGSCKRRSMMRPTLTISIFVHFIYL